MHLTLHQQTSAHIQCVTFGGDFECARMALRSEDCSVSGLGAKVLPLEGLF